jgi:hypothetical protein
MKLIDGFGERNDRFAQVLGMVATCVVGISIRFASFKIACPESAVNQSPKVDYAS